MQKTRFFLRIFNCINILRAMLLLLVLLNMVETTHIACFKDSSQERGTPKNRFYLESQATILPISESYPPVNHFLVAPFHLHQTPWALSRRAHRKLFLMATSTITLRREGIHHYQKHLGLTHSNQHKHN